jgi:hypothetical protein
MKKILFAVVILLLTTPIIVGLFSVVKEPPLDGAFIGEKEYTLKYFTWERWFDDQFQEAMIKLSAQKTGFRNSLIRLANHLDFVILQKLHAEKAILGKNNFLYEEGYIVDYIGRNYMGEEYIRENLNRFKKAQDILKEKYNITVILVLEPGKAGVYPESIPDKYFPTKRTTSNYDTYHRLSKVMGVNCLDLQAYFRAIKDTISYPLYSKYGVHWSTYGMYLATDTMLKYTQKITQINVPQLKWNGLEVTDKLKDVDFDLEKTLNLFYELPHELLAYPKITFDTVEKTRPRALTIADSYNWSLFDNKIPHYAFSNTDFWYYNNTIYPNIWGENANWVKNLNVIEEIKSNKIIYMMITEMNLYKAFWGFPDTVLQHELPNYKSPQWFYESRQIVENQEDYQSLITYCINYRKPFNKELSALSLFLANTKQNPKLPKSKWFWIAQYENQIYTNTEMLSSCKEKAVKSNISLRKAVYNDAVWLYNEKFK